MDIYDETFINFWKASNKFQLKCILIGDLAISLHANTSFGNNVEIWIKDTPENRKNLYEVFKETGMGDLKSLLTIQFIPGWTDFYLDNGVRLDIMTSVKGLEQYSFDDAYKTASVAEIENIKVPFLHINQLIQAKKATNRPEDQVDVIALEKIKKLREEGN
ncbi:MAG: hypothetical protein ABIP95_16595 [Pelobium sp.]